MFAAVQGAPCLALGNAVGSIIADTGLIVGLAALIGPIPVDRKLVSRQGWIQSGSAFLLVLVRTVRQALGHFHGFIFLAFLGVYIWRSIAWSRTANPDDNTLASEISLLLIGITLVIVSSHFLIPAVAVRLRIPGAITAATLVACGTSLPVLVTAITAVCKKHGN